MMPPIQPPSARNNKKPQWEPIRNPTRFSRNINASRIVWCQGLALVFGLLGILLATYEDQAISFGEPVTCGLGNPPCTSATVQQASPEVILHPFATIGYI